MKSSVHLLPRAAEQVRELGLRLRMARERRGISQVLFSERVGCSRETLRRLELGDSTVSLSTLMRALRVLSLDKDVDLLAVDAELKQKLAELDPPGIQIGKQRR